MNRIILILFLSCILTKGMSQESDSLVVLQTDSSLLINETDLQQPKMPPVSTDLTKLSQRRQIIGQMILPVALTAYGYFALGNKSLNSLDNKIKDEIWTEKPHQPNNFDDWLQYMPGFSVYVLNGLGIHGKSNLLDATRKYFISSLLMTAVVQSTKAVTRLKRPDGFGTNAFPSGHTSTAFVAAEFLNQEYKDRSPLYSITGYAMATLVGYMRIYNNRHWFKDVVAGAGIGIGVTKFVYWIYPTIKRKFFKDKPMNTMVMPFYQNKTIGFSLVHSFAGK